MIDTKNEPTSDGMTKERYAQLSRAFPKTFLNEPTWITIHNLKEENKALVEEIAELKSGMWLMKDERILELEVQLIFWKDQVRKEGGSKL